MNFAAKFRFSFRVCHAVVINKGVNNDKVMPEGFIAYAYGSGSMSLNALLDRNEP